MFDVYSELATDESLENNGAWFPIGKDSRLLVARSNNKAYSRMLTKVIENNRVALDADPDGELGDKLTADVMAETILLGWENMGYQKKPLEYSIANAKLLLGVKDFRVMVGRLSSGMDAYKVKEEAEQGKV